MRWFVLILTILVSCASSNSDESPEPRQCEQLRDHLVDLQVGQIHIATGIDREAHRSALSKALGDDFIGSCTGKMSASQVECALAAGDPTAAAGCSR